MINLSQDFFTQSYALEAKEQLNLIVYFIGWEWTVGRQLEWLIEWQLLQLFSKNLHVLKDLAEF